MWLTSSFQKLCKKFPLKEVFFHHCRYGSSRRKLTKFLHNIPSLQLLESYCDNTRTHEPWGQSPAGHWRTSEETAYPWDLCRAIASKLALQLQEDGFQCQRPAFATQEAGLQTMRATTSLQPRRGLPPMVPEFKQIITHPANMPLPHQGIHASGNGCSSHSHNASGPDTEHTITVGVHHTPEEFVQQALVIGHPTRFHSFFPDEMNEVVQHCAHNTPGGLAQERTEEIKRWIHLASSLSEAEHRLKENMSSRRKQVLQGKNLLLFKALMEDAKHRDSDLVDQLASGFDLTGGLPESNVFARKMRPAAMSCVELRRISELCRQSMLQTVVSSGDPELDSQLYAATMKEVSKGFLIGPVELADLPEGSTLTRCFGVKQKSKTRPIDDYKASFVNSSVSQTETATAHTVDHIASLIACIKRTSDELGTSVSLSAKTWDLADAYKQIPLSDHAFDNDGFLAVYNPSEKRAEIFQQKVLPFGSVASVTAFLRVAHGIRKVGARLLRLMWTSYFDDFLSVTTSETSRHTDLMISSLFCILGWKLSEDKLIDYHTMCKVVVVEFDLRMSGQGLAAVANTQDRAKELCEELDTILVSGSLRRAEGERLRGRLQFASGQLFGRSARIG